MSSTGSTDGTGRHGTADRDVRRARHWARVALLMVVGAALVVTLGAGSGGWLVLVGGLVGLAVAGAGLWWALTHRRLGRLLGAVVAVGAPVGVIVMYAASGLWPVAVGGLSLWAAALASARSALRKLRRPRAMRTRRTPRPRRPVLIMNPRSGGGKVERHDLVTRAETLGCRVILIDPDAPTDPGLEATRALAAGADCLGVAGGDGTQAQVAAVAAAHGVPFLVVPAGTRNHFAMDLGLDRADPVRSLDALTDGVELRVDLGDVDGRPSSTPCLSGRTRKSCRAPSTGTPRRPPRWSTSPTCWPARRAPRWTSASTTPSCTTRRRSSSATTPTPAPTRSAADADRGSTPGRSV